MDTNRAFIRSMRFLSRPVVPLLLGVLLTNDLLLRRLWPSWLTGKLSDFAWLFVAPVVASALLAWLIPAGWKRQEKITGLLAYGLTALAFTLIKTVPTLRDALVQFWQSSLGFPTAVVIDPTDLLALAMLVLSAVLWLREEPLPNRIPLRGWLVLPLFALFTLADAVAPDYGIACLGLQNNQVTTAAGYSSFVSNDGGLTWSSNAAPNHADYGMQACDSTGAGSFKVIDLPTAKLRSYPGSRIEISRDGGSTWQVEYHLTGETQAQDAYYVKYASGNPIFKPGPLAALFDPASGNVIFAMGHEGVLVRRANATYTWAPAGNYRRFNLSSPDVFITVLGGELVLAASLVMLLLAAWGLTAQKSHWALELLVVGGWLLLGIGVYISPARQSLYGIEMSWIFLMVMLALALSVGIYSLTSRLHRSAWRVALAAVACGLVFLLPYILWYNNILPDYTTAAIAAGIFAFICAVVFYALAARKANAGPPQ